MNDSAFMGVESERKSPPIIEQENTMLSAKIHKLKSRQRWPKI